MLQHAHLHSNNLHNLQQSGVQTAEHLLHGAAHTESRVVMVISYEGLETGWCW